MASLDQPGRGHGGSKPPANDPNPGGGGWLPPQWGSWVLYGIMVLLLLWVWQEAFRQVSARTIPYSQFKSLLRNGEITQCSVAQDEITGTIQAKAGAITNAAAAAVPHMVSNRTAVAASATNHLVSERPVSRASATRSSAVTEKAPPTSLTQQTAVVTQKGNATLTKPAAYQFRTVRVEDPDLVHDLEKAGVKFRGVRPGFMGQFLWAWVIPIAAVFLLWRFLARRMGSLGQSFMNIGSSRAKLVADRDTGVTFSDVAGCDEAKYELQEVVSFLKDPQRYQALGATIPKGTLLVGPPGTGKTLLARAVAGEAQVPFFLISGSDFVEMFVGVGAARVRDLFQKAKAQAPCIVFIDELDAVGRQRGVHLGPVNDEREQTLNQLLVGMDGFEANVGVIVLAATNRPEVLDRALLRPGRFDRQVVVDAPDLEGRWAILKLHARLKPLAPEVDLRQIAQETPGFTGADLANVVNEAALLAARHQGTTVSHKDIEEAVEKVVAGPERKSRRLSKEERRRVACHEVGHALVAHYSRHADPVHKITIIPRGRVALGYTLQLPTEDQHLMSQSELTDRIKGMLGGRAAEEVIFHEVSTGAENDLERATALARQMVAMFGMSERVGLAHCAQRQSPFVPAGADGYLQRDCSEETAHEIDREVKQLLAAGYAGAKAILLQHREQLDLVAQELLKRETLDAGTFKRLLGESSAAKPSTASASVPCPPDRLRTTSPVINPSK